MRFKFAQGRINFLTSATLVLMALFVGKLFFLQIVQHQYYADMANSEQMKQFVLHAKRGEIYSFDAGQPKKLVMNQTVYTVWVDPTVVTDKQEIVRAVSEVAGGNTRPNFSKYLDVKNTRYQVLATRVSQKQAEMLKAKKLQGIGFDAVIQRVYPEGSLASQLLGFVDAEGNGKYGFEQANDSMLKGRDGTLRTVTDIRDVPLSIGANNINKPAVDGKNYVLSIDRNIQAQTEKALSDGIDRVGATQASAIVMDPTNGRVLAMANLPSYDPSQLSQVSDPALFNNAVISSPYEPASDIKAFTMAVGVDKGVITPATTYVNTGQTQVEDIVINNASKNPELSGTISMQTALNWSLNTGVVKVAELLGDGRNINYKARETIYDYFHNRFRLGTLTGVELAGEQKGIIVPPTEVEGNAVRYSNMVFGQGMDVTLLQVASGFCSLINGGTYYEPTVIAGVMDGNNQFQADKSKAKYDGVISRSSSETVKEMVHQSHYATYRPHNEPAGYYIGGKTGTAQAVKNGKYIFEETVGTYLGFGGEVGKPSRYVIMVTVSGKNMKLGGGDAKPIFLDISNWLINYLGLAPEAS